MSLFNQSPVNHPGIDDIPNLPRAWFFFLVLLTICLSLFLRSAALQNVTLLDDHDSVFYIQSIEAYSSLLWEEINRLNSDSTPGYPIFSALANHWVSDSEFSGRLISLLASCLLVIMVALIAAKLHSPLAGLIAALFLTFNPLELSLAVAVLTEMLYQALIYTGFYLLLRQYTSKKLSISLAAVIALAFGLSFLTKTEGVLFLVLCPLVMLAGRFMQHKEFAMHTAINLSSMRWIAVFVTIFIIILAPQILHVSSKMGTTSLNGRVAWQLLVGHMPEKPLNAAIYGLDLDDATTNIEFARTDYAEAATKLTAITDNTSIPSDRSSVLIERSKLSLKNIDKIYRTFLGNLLSPLGVFFLFFGILSCFLRASKAAVIFVLFMFAGVIVAPILHTSVLTRQMAQALPLFSILQAIGLLETALLIFSFSRIREPMFKGFLILLLVLALAISQLVPVAKTVLQPSANKEYAPDIIEEPANLLRQLSDDGKLVARKSYLSHFSGLEHIYMPYTDIEGLINYLKLNDAHYVYIDYELLKDYPFTYSFINGDTDAEFETLWTKIEQGQRTSSLHFLKMN